MNKLHYSPPWTDVSIIGIAGSSGSGKTSLSVEIIKSLNLPWVIILSMDSFYKPLTAEQSVKAFRNEYDFDSPEAIDFDILVERLKDLKKGVRAEIPIYSFDRHQREAGTTTIYSPHVLILEGIFALYDQRVLDILDLRIFAEADADLCLSRRIIRDVRDRGRDIEGCIKQWFGFVKPNFLRYVEPQREVADIIVPRGVENKVAIDMVVHHVKRTLAEKSKKHRQELARLGQDVGNEPLSSHVLLLKEAPQIQAMNTIIQNPYTIEVEFIFYFDRLATLLVERSVYPVPMEAGIDVLRAMDNLHFKSKTITTPTGQEYHGLCPSGEVSAVVIQRAGSCFETGLKRVIPDCRVGRVLIKTNFRTGEPELHYQSLAPDIATHNNVLLLDPQMSSGGAALMAVRVLVDHGVPEESIVFVTYFAGRLGLKRFNRVFPAVKVVVCEIVDDYQERWIEQRYFGC